MNFLEEWMNEFNEWVSILLKIFVGIRFFDNNLGISYRTHLDDVVLFDSGIGMVG